MKKSPLLLPLAGLLALCGSAGAEPLTLKDGVYTEAQAEAGKATYEKSCKNCHETAFYEDKLKVWKGQPLIGFYDLISTTMPADSPGGLWPEDYTQALAYILSELGYPAGDKKLEPYDGSMDEIIIE